LFDSILVAAAFTSKLKANNMFNFYHTHTRALSTPLAHHIHHIYHIHHIHHISYLQGTGKSWMVSDLIVEFILRAFSCLTFIMEATLYTFL